MRRFASALLRSDRAAAAAEMALVTPMLMVLMFGAFELGNYFLSEHVVAKAVRDGARYAARQALSSYSCPSTVDPASTGLVGRVQNLTRTGAVTGGSTRLAGWTSNATVTVTLSCTAAVSGGTTVYSGIYKGMANVPVVTVSANVPYQALFNSLGFSSASLHLRAESQSAVMGA